MFWPLDKTSIMDREAVVYARRCSWKLVRSKQGEIQYTRGEARRRKSTCFGTIREFRELGPRNDYDTDTDYP